MKVAKTLLICIIIVLVICAILCHIIAISSSNWLSSSDEVQTKFLNIGLWQACFDDYIHKHEREPKVYNGCHDLYSDYYSTIQDWLIPSWLEVSRILAVIALILQLVGVLAVIILLLWVLCKWVCCQSKDDRCERCLCYFCPIIWMLAGMFVMMVVMIWADNAFRLQCKDFWVGGGDPNVNTLGWSWGFEVAACVFSFVSGLFLIWLVVLKGREEL